VNRRTKWALPALGAGALALAGVTSAAAGQASSSSTSFHMVRSAGAVAANCLKGASADVTVKSLGPVEVMTVKAKGLVPNAEYDLFINQVPNAPFGLSWYQGDLESNSKGKAEGKFVGRFSIETFTVAPGVAPAPVVHPTDASSNPATPPVHQYHVGLWFGSPEVAAAAGCPTTVTPFNGDHTAGIQALSTRNFADDRGPLRQVHP
jgi:hypothetical protein